MNKPIFFREVQRFNQWWFWLLMIVVLSFNIVHVLTKFTDDNRVFVVMFITLLVFLLLVSMKLDTEITDEGIYVRSFPLMLKARHIPWSDIDKAYTREYAPVKEYGGWGIRGFASNRAYNVSGKQGLQLELKNGRRVLIGTQKPSEIDAILKSINKYNA